MWSIALYGAENLTLRAIYHKHLEIFEMWCWRRMEKISWTNCVKNEKVLKRVKEERNTFLAIQKKEGSLDWSHLA
jgi:hypothetical protein